MSEPVLRSSPTPAQRSQRVIVAALGFTQILGYGTSYYLLAILSVPIASDTGWPLPWVIAGLSLGMLVGGIASPLIGRAIDRCGGRPLLMLGSLLLAVGLAGVGLAYHVALYLAAWCVIGVGMGAGLYEAAFGALGRLYGRDARAAITTLTLYGGFASTICWPLTAFLNDAVGWRSTCFIYAGVHLFVALPLHLIFPRASVAQAETQPHSSDELRSAGSDLASGRATTLILLAVHLTLTAVIATIVSVHLLVILEARGYSSAAAVALGTLLGPSQVAGRAIELVVGRSFHPLWTAIASSGLIAAGLAALLSGLPLVALAIVIYGAGAGVSYIVRGTLPLALFGAAGYASLMGRLAFPSLIAQALAPWVAAFAFTRTGLDAFLVVLLMMGILNLVLIGSVARIRRDAEPPSG